MLNNDKGVAVCDASKAW